MEYEIRTNEDNNWRKLEFQTTTLMQIGFALTAAQSLGSWLVGDRPFTPKLVTSTRLFGMISIKGVGGKVKLINTSTGEPKKFKCHLQKG